MMSSGLAADEKRHHPDRTRRTEVRCFPVPEPPGMHKIKKTSLTGS